MIGTSQTGAPPMVIQPSGILMPIFSVRKVQTQVTIFDGATVIIGGLTREEVKTVNDKIPVLGNIPLIGRLFQSSAESYQKRNLLIFVTASIVSRGGSPVRENIQNITHMCVRNLKIFYGHHTGIRSPYICVILSSYTSLFYI